MDKDVIISRMIRAIKVREEMHKILEKYKVKTTLCKESVNAYHNQLTDGYDGIICEYSYDVPKALYTPLGSLRIVSNGWTDSVEATKAVEEIERTFGFKLKSPQVKTTIGSIGGWYYITKLPWDSGEIECLDYIEDESKNIAYNVAKYLYAEALEMVE